MKIDRDEEQAAIQWLNRHGEAPGVVGLHAWVSGLDAGTRKALGQYLRLRRHRLHAPKVALEITADVHAALSDYVVKEGSASLSDAIGRLLCASHGTAGQSGPAAEFEALREALVARGKRKEPLSLAVAPPCPLCGGEMRPEVANGSRLWVCMTPSGCTGTRDLDENLVLSAELIGADLARAWRHAKGNDAAKAASVVKWTVAALERATQEHARYWSAGEVASFRAAAAALGKLASACEQTP